MKRYMVVIFIIFIMLPVELVAQGNISAARDAFFSKDMAGADQLLQNELLDNPLNQEAHFFRVITRILSTMESNPNSPYTGIYTDSMIGMLDQFGFSSTGRDLFGFSSKPPSVLPVNSPSGGDIQTFVENVILTEISQAITDNLHNIDAAFSVVITEAELVKFDIHITQPLEIDYGDVKLLEAVLHVLEAGLLSYLSYDVNVDIDELGKLEGMIDLQGDVFPDYPLLFKIRSGKEGLFRQAQMSVKNAIAAYLTGVDFIKTETDEQATDLVTIDSEDFGKEEELRLQLISIRDALDDYAHIKLNNNKIAFVNLTRFFDATFDIRSQLPSIAIDTETLSMSDNGNLPDPTFHGIIPSVEFDVQTNQLHLPVVKTERGDFEVIMYMPNPEFLEFSVLTAVPISNNINSPANFTFNTGILNMPLVDVVLGTNNRAQYSVEMLLNPKTTLFGVVDITEK